MQRPMWENGGIIYALHGSRRCFCMGIRLFFSYETIVRATSGEAEAVDEALQAYPNRRHWKRSHQQRHRGQHKTASYRCPVPGPVRRYNRLHNRRCDLSVKYLHSKIRKKKLVEEAIAAFADMIPLETIQPPHSPTLVFPGLEIRLHQHRVLKDGADIYLTRLEYSVRCYLAASPGRVFTKAQI